DRRPEAGFTGCATTRRMPMARTLFLAALAAPLGLAGLAGYEVLRVGLEADVYRERLEQASRDYAVLPDRYDEAIRRTAAPAPLGGDPRRGGGRARDRDALRPLARDLRRLRRARRPALDPARLRRPHAAGRGRARRPAARAGRLGRARRGLRQGDLSFARARA